MLESIRGRYSAISGCRLVTQCSAGASRNFQSTLGHDRIPASSRWTGIFVFLALRRLGVAQWIACIPAAVPLLCGDHFFLEHTVMSDFLFDLAGDSGSLSGYSRISSPASLWVACGRECSSRSGWINAQRWFRPGAGTGRMQCRLVQVFTSA